MTLTRFRNGFWYGFVASALLLLVPALLWARLAATKLPPKPPFPVPGRQFVAEYAGQAAYVAHLAYWWGLFGIGQRIRDADIVLLGSSHMQFGLSARQLSATLSQRANRPVRVFNAGLGCDTPLGYDGALLDHLRLGGRTLVIDLFAYDFDPYNAPCFAELAGMTDAVHAGAKALTVWSRFAWDWSLDGALPRVDLRGGRVALTRYLNAPATILDWNYGDAAHLYRPDRGEEFPSPPPDRPQDLTAQEGAWRLDGATLALPQAFAGAVSLGAQPVFTLIPFSTTPAFDRDRYDHVAQLLAATGGVRAAFIALAPQGLKSFDGEHLTGDSRAAATARLAPSLVAAKLAPRPQSGP